MGKFIDACRNAILGVLSGFDRLMLHGRLRSLEYQDGAQMFFGQRNILFKDAKAWMEQQTRVLIRDVEAIAQQATGHGITHLPSARLRKDEIARKAMRDRGITTGIIGAWSCTEECRTFQLRPAQGAPVLVPITSRCRHLYLYLQHPVFGFMNLRLQTWFPYMLQVALNGREWLCQSLTDHGIAHERHRNKITACDDFSAAQHLLDEQVQIPWTTTLQQLVPTIFPRMEQVVGDRHAYTWYTWQSEWATDFIFADQRALYDQMDHVIRSAFTAGTSDALFRFFDRSVNNDGRLRKGDPADVASRMLHFGDGIRLRHWLDGNSIKVYNEANNLRLEGTVNSPGRFKIKRPVGNDPQPKMAPMRKSVCDLPARARVGEQINRRFAASLAAPQDDAKPVQDLIASITKRCTKNGRRVRALDPMGKDRLILQAIANPAELITGFTNKAIRAKLRQQKQYAGKTDAQLAGYVTRTIRLLRDHGLIRKYPNQWRYGLTDKGAQITATIAAVLSANTKALTEMAA